MAPPVPVELAPFGLKATLRALGDVALRDAPPTPDGGIVADYHGPIDDPAAVAAWLDATPGVVGHGLFAPELVTEIMVATGDRVARRAP